MLQTLLSYSLMQVCRITQHHTEDQSDPVTYTLTLQNPYLVQHLWISYDIHMDATWLCYWGNY